MRIGAESVRAINTKKALEKRERAHHVIYVDAVPMMYTFELCVSCHSRLSAASRRMAAFKAALPFDPEKNSGILPAAMPIRKPVEEEPATIEDAEGPFWVPRFILDLLYGRGRRRLDEPI